MRNVWVLLILLLAGMTASYADSESDGTAAEQAGRYREALNQYTDALQRVSEGSAKDQALREKIISLVQKLTPPPAVPEEAEKYLMRGQGAVEMAQKPEDFKVAIAEFQKAARLAPWWADIYYNLGLVQDKAGLYAEGIRSLKLCLKAAPNAPDAKKIELMLVKLEFKQEQAQKEAATKNAETQKLAEQKAMTEKLNGQWTVARGYIQKSSREESCEYRFPNPGYLFSIEVRGGQIEIYLMKESGTYCDGSRRIPRYPINLLKFRGTIQNNQISGTLYCHRPTEQAMNKNSMDITKSDYEGCGTRSHKAEILWDSDGSSFTISPNLPWTFPQDYPQKWERE